MTKSGQDVFGPLQRSKDGKTHSYWEIATYVGMGFANLNSMVFTLGYQAMRYNQFNDQRQQFHGAKARFDLGRESWAVYPESSAIDMKSSRERRSPGSFESASRAHVLSFLECLRTRREPIATVEVGQSTNVVLGMDVESMRSGRRVLSDAAAKQIRH